MSSPLQQLVSQPPSLDQTDPLLLVAVEMPPSPDLWSDLSTDNNLDVVSSNVMPSTPKANDHEVPMEIIRVNRSLIREDMIEIFLDPSILKLNLNAIIRNQHGHEEAGHGNGVQREVNACTLVPTVFLCHKKMKNNFLFCFPFSYNIEKWNSNF